MLYINRYLMDENMVQYLINFVILALIYFLFFYKKWYKVSKKVFIINTLMYIYITMVLGVTLMPFPVPFLNGTNNLFLETCKCQYKNDQKVENNYVQKVA